MAVPNLKLFEWVTQPRKAEIHLSQEAQMAWEAAGESHGAEAITIENCKFSRNVPGPFEDF
ncbi:hypothetical protein N7519_007094 [Penicillium mononematosum]|uniref:uncharacterized protein n=1 Tax=Penicillium mononematosum TaxID=268346 RepID=UPI0025478781|nr:uncharacterized protein N7519_007094 [Penicillium mononematosum]KAJ6185793.1 hypothetical protein N7519_007094 [Penicillium mononematosum]